MRKRNLQLVPFLVSPLLAFVCEPGHGPVIYNALDNLITISVQYKNGDTISLELAPHSKLWTHSDAIAVNSLEVRREGEVLYIFEAAALERLKTGFPVNAQLMWKIHEHGLRVTTVSY